MTKKFKLFGLFNILDLFVVAAVIVLISGTIYKYNIPGMSSDESKIVYTVDISNVREFSLQYYQPGLSCYDSKTGEFIGTIVDIRSQPFTDLLINRSGEVIIADVPGALKIELDIEIDGLETERGYFARGVYELKVGSEIHLCTKYVEVSTTLRDINYFGN